MKEDEIPKPQQAPIKKESNKEQRDKEYEKGLQDDLGKLVQMYHLLGELVTDRHIVVDEFLPTKQSIANCIVNNVCKQRDSMDLKEAQRVKEMKEKEREEKNNV